MYTDGSKVLLQSASPEAAGVLSVKLSSRTICWQAVAVLQNHPQICRDIHEWLQPLHQICVFSFPGYRTREMVARKLSRGS